jgi:hypothetical protein
MPINVVQSAEYWFCDDASSHSRMGTPVVAFTARQALRAFLQLRREAFTNPLVYTFVAVKARQS